MFDLRLWLESLIAPTALLAWCLAFLTLATWRHPAPKTLRFGASASLLVFLMLSTPLAVDPAFSMLQQAARSEQRCGPPPPGSVLIVLAGGLNRNPAQVTDFNALRSDSLRRTLFAVALAQRTPHSVLLFSGGGGTRFREADVMGALAQALGFAPDRIVLDRTSRTTAASAINTRAMPAGDSGRPRYLITSAYHMPRANMAFRDAGQKVCAWPVDFLDTEVPPPELFTPGIGSLQRSTLLLHEALGMVFYRLKAAL
jgi:uncharacterized SAM-binding protein YcdF (DUF218 family)